MRKPDLFKPGTVLQRLAARKQTIVGIIVFALLMGWTVFSQRVPAGCELILYNGRIWVDDCGETLVEAIALANNKIVDSGSSVAVLKLKGKTTRMINLAGRQILLRKQSPQKSGDFAGSILSGLGLP